MMLLCFVVSPGDRRQTLNVPVTSHLAHSSRRSAGGQAVSRRQQVSHTVRQPVNPIQPQVGLLYLLCITWLGLALVSIWLRSDRREYSAVTTDQTIHWLQSVALLSCTDMRRHRDVTDYLVASHIVPWCQMRVERGELSVTTAVQQETACCWPAWVNRCPLAVMLVRNPAVSSLPLAFHAHCLSWNPAMLSRGWARAIQARRHHPHSMTDTATPIINDLLASV